MQKTLVMKSTGSVLSELMKFHPQRVFFKTRYMRELSVQLAERKWHDAILDLIIMFNGKFALSLLEGVALYQEIPSEIT
jgi:hypothetical protein